MRNATLAFCILALTSSSAPPLLLIVLPNYLKESISSSGSRPSVTGKQNKILMSTSIGSPKLKLENLSKH